MSGCKFAKTSNTQNTKNCIQSVKQSAYRYYASCITIQYKAELYHHSISKISEKNEHVNQRLIGSGILYSKDFHCAESICKRNFIYCSFFVCKNFK